MANKHERLMVNDISVTILRKRIKHVYISIKAPDGHVVVSAPNRVPIQQITQLIQEKQQWILRKQAECRNKANAVPDNIAKQQYRTGDIVTLWGEQYQLQEDINDIKAWYRTLLKIRIAELLPVLETQTGLYCNEWRIKDMKTRWGSCNTKAKRIWLNLKLVQYPEACLEYVILHELIHLKVPNHSSIFYAELDAYMPDWQQRRKWLEKIT